MHERIMKILQIDGKQLKIKSYINLKNIIKCSKEDGNYCIRNSIRRISIMWNKFHPKRWSTTSGWFSNLSIPIQSSFMPMSAVAWFAVRIPKANINIFGFGWIGNRNQENYEQWQQQGRMRISINYFPHTIQNATKLNEATVIFIVII